MGKGRLGKTAVAAAKALRCTGQRRRTAVVIRIT